MKKNTLFFLLLLGNISAFTQVSFEKRIEFELKDGYDSERIMEFGKDGFIMCSRNKTQKEGQTEWKYELYDTDLLLKATRSVLINQKYFVRNEEDFSFSNTENNFTLYRNNKGKYSLVVVNASTLKISKVDGVLPKKIRAYKMVALGNFVFINAAMKKEAMLISINWKTGQQKVIPIIIETHPKRFSITNMQVLKKSKELLVFVKTIEKKKVSNLYVLRFNGGGKKEESFNFSKNFDQKIVTISGSKTGDNEYVFTGTYSTKSASYSEGLFFSKVYDGKIDFIKFYNFLNLKNFLSYLPKKKQKKIENKKKRKDKKGKEMKISYNIADHDVVKVKDGYLFLGECYYPTYYTEYYTTTSTVNGVTTTTTHTRQVFDGYQYTHAILSEFNEQGELVWDQIFELWPSYKPFSVKRFISFTETSDNAINLVFASWNKIYSKSFDYDGRIISDEESEEIKTGYSGDKAKRSFSNLDYWYDNYFLAYGNQTIKNTETKKVKRKRKVYFVSKIKF